MDKLGLNEIRKAFRDFYVEKGHYPGKSASLIPKNDKSLLIINSGMAPLKPYFAGVETPPAKRMTTCQKCIRTGDIDNVGITARHGTFFEMLGNFSFGDYFKEESLNWGWEFITKVLKMPVDKIWATVYENDDQAVEIWKKIGLPAEHIVRLGKEDNFWEIGLGPCGPCSELHYDRGPEYGCGKPDCKPGCDCDRYLEFWNHVFTQFSKEEDGSYSDLSHPNIDTGMGLERIACIMQGVDSIFDIDTIRHILDGVVDKAGVKYEDGTASTDISIRIITDHLRSMVFMIADGILPSNEGRGYVLRRLIRRASRHGKLLGIKDEFLVELSNKVIEVSGEAYPELIEKKEYIQKIISVEEEKFSQTIDQGTSIINEYIDELKHNNITQLSGEQTFKLYDTYGFPLELTQEILMENGFTADVDGFNDNMKKQKELARSCRKNTACEAWKDSGIPENVNKSEFVGYDVLSCKSKIVAMFSEKGIVESVGPDSNVRIFLDKTPFYAEGGGQVCDKGIMSTNNSCLNVFSVEKQDGVYIHCCEVVDGEFNVGDTVTCLVDNTYRYAVARNHTATHLLQKSLQQVFGNHIQQAGSSVNEKELRFDFTHFEALNGDQLREVESIVNNKISEFLPVVIKEMSMDEASKEGAMALFGEKYGDVVRVVNIGNWSKELCGGTHIHNTGEIGSFKILSETGVASGVRRIVAVTGYGVVEASYKQDDLINELCQISKANFNTIINRVKTILNESKDLKKELADLKKASMGDESESLINQAKIIKDVKLITKEFKDYNVNDLRTLSDDIKKNTKSVIMVFATVNGPKVNFMVSVSEDLLEKGYHAGNMIKKIASAAGGGGGGKADMAQAGAKEPSKINDAFKVAEELI